MLLLPPHVCTFSRLQRSSCLRHMEKAPSLYSPFLEYGATCKPFDTAMLLLCDLH